MRRLFCLMALAGILIISSGCIEEKTWTITVVDKTTKVGSVLSPGQQYYFTDGKEEYLTNWLTYRKLELNRTYQFIPDGTYWVLKEK